MEDRPVVPPHLQAYAERQERRREAERRAKRNRRILHWVDAAVVALIVVLLTLAVCGVCFRGQTSTLQLAIFYFVLRALLALLGDLASGRRYDAEELRPWDGMERGGPSSPG